jgi:hypothetical protein
MKCCAPPPLVSAEAVDAGGVSEVYPPTSGAGGVTKSGPTAQAAKTSNGKDKAAALGRNVPNGVPHANSGVPAFQPPRHTDHPTHISHEPLNRAE